MGTRGAIGFAYGNTLKLTYNHWDSYPSELGKRVATDLVSLFAEHDEQHIRNTVESIVMVKDQDAPTAEQIVKYNLDEKCQDFYDVLHNDQGSLMSSFKRGLMIEYNDFPKNSLFCEWAYIFDLDRKVLEVYKGFQETKPTVGRFVDAEPDGGYYGCNLVEEIPLNNLTSGMAELIAKFN
jgi:hypothetical protein